jgi:hypothetical protein
MKGYVLDPKAYAAMLARAFNDGLAVSTRAATPIVPVIDAKGGRRLES